MLGNNNRRESEDAWRFHCKTTELELEQLDCAHGARAVFFLLHCNVVKDSFFVSVSGAWTDHQVLCLFVLLTYPKQRITQRDIICVRREGWISCVFLMMMMRGRCLIEKYDNGLSVVNVDDVAHTYGSVHVHVKEWKEKKLAFWTHSRHFRPTRRCACCFYKEQRTRRTRKDQISFFPLVSSLVFRRYRRVLFEKQVWLHSFLSPKLMIIFITKHIKATLLTNRVEYFRVTMSRYCMWLETSFASYPSWTYHP